MSEFTATENIFINEYNDNLNLSDNYSNNLINNKNYHFTLTDYVIFGGMLFISAITGLYHGLRGRKNLTTRKYLMGSDMQVVPVAFSLIASYVSGVTILGTPAEIYNYGTQYCLIVFSIWIMGLIVSSAYLPVFSQLRVTSSYEYLQLRFDGRVRTLASILFILDELMFLPILVYVPALAFNQVTGVPLHTVGIIVCAVCITYTVIGGLKAVVWTDTLQIVVMFISVVVVVIIGTLSLGGVAEVLAKSAEGGRVILFNTNPSLYERHTIWSVLIGGTFYWTSFNSVNQTMVQRYLSLDNLKRAQYSLALFSVGISIFVLLCCYAGLLVFTAYGNCDPRSAGLVLADDQLLPIFVTEVTKDLPGLSGLFIAGVFGAALSSLSVVLNSTATVILQDVVRGLFGLKPGDKTATIFAKFCTLGLGLLALASLLWVEKLGGVLAAASSLSAIAAGTSFGVFTLGMLVPWCSSNGALLGATLGALMSGWVSFGSQWAAASGLLSPNTLNVSVNSCPSNITLFQRNFEPPYEVFPLYRLSYHWITPIGTCTTIFVGMLASIVLGKQKKVDKELLSPVLSWFNKSETRDMRDSSLTSLKDQETMFSE